MKSYIVYNNSTGQILRTGACPDDMVSIQKLSIEEDVIEGEAHDLTQYVIFPSLLVINKEANPASIDKISITADGIDTATISDLPNPTDVRINKDKYVVTDGTFEFTVDTTGTYIIICDAFPYLLKEFTVDAS